MKDSPPNDPEPLDALSKGEAVGVFLIVMALGSLAAVPIYFLFRGLYAIRDHYLEPYLFVLEIMDSDLRAMAWMCGTGVTYFAFVTFYCRRSRLLFLRRAWFDAKRINNIGTKLAALFLIMFGVAWTGLGLRSYLVVSDEGIREGKILEFSELGYSFSDIAELRKGVCTADKHDRRKRTYYYFVASDGTTLNKTRSGCSPYRWPLITNKQAIDLQRRIAEAVGRSP